MICAKCLKVLQGQPTAFSYTNTGERKAYCTNHVPEFNGGKPFRETTAMSDTAATEKPLKETELRG